MYYKNMTHCESAMAKLLNRHNNSSHPIEDINRHQLIYLSCALYHLELEQRDKFKHSLTGNLYWAVKNDLEKNGKLRNILDYYGIIDELKLKEEV